MIVYDRSKRCYHYHSCERFLPQIIYTEKIESNPVCASISVTAGETFDIETPFSEFLCITSNTRVLPRITAARQAASDKGTHGNARGHSVYEVYLIHSFFMVRSL